MERDSNDVNQVGYPVPHIAPVGTPAAPVTFATYPARCTPTTAAPANTVPVADYLFSLVVIDSESTNPAAEMNPADLN